MKEKFKGIVQKTRQSYRSLPDKKPYIEFFTTLLSVPVLLTVILLNVNNLRAEKKSDPSPPTPEKEVVYISPETTTKNTTDRDQSSNNATNTPSPTSNEACKKGIGTVDIQSPKEDETITNNPVAVIVAYKAEGYCAVVWSYRINGGAWSDYDDKSIALYNMKNGNSRITLKVKSIVTGEEKVLERNFIYAGAPKETSSASGSAL